MNLGAIKKVKTANAEEHLKVVLQDIKIANEELTRVLSLIGNAQEILDGYNDKIVNKSKEFAQVSLDLEAKIKSNELEDKRIKEESEDLIRKQKTFESEKMSRITMLVQLDKKLEEAVKFYDNAIIDYEKKLEAKRIELDKLIHQVTILVEDTKTASIELKTLNNEIEKKKKEKEVLENEFNRFVANSKKEREEIQNKIKQELLIVENPRKLLKEREINVARKERDVGILIKRFRKEFVKLHPNLDPKI